MAGNLIVVYVVWSNASAVTVTDTKGNGYASRRAGDEVEREHLEFTGVLREEHRRRRQYGACDLRDRHQRRSRTLYIHEYSGLDKANPLDVSAAAVGTAQRDEQRYGDHHQRDRPDLRGRRLHRHT